MSYRAILSNNAQADIRQMPAPLARFTLAQLQNLEASPTTLSRRSHFPFRERCQVFTFDFAHEGHYYVVNVLFQYAADEQQLHIADIPWTDAPEIWL
jgi:hypothetical protein